MRFFPAEWCPRMLVAVCVALVCSRCSEAATADEPLWKAGIAKAIITPDKPSGSPATARSVRPTASCTTCG